MVRIFPVVSGSDTVEVAVRAEGPGGLGDVFEEVRQGEKAFGHTYDALRDRAEGKGPELFYRPTDTSGFEVVSAVDFPNVATARALMRLTGDDLDTVLSMIVTNPTAAADRLEMVIED